MAVKRTMYQRKVDVDMLNAVKIVLAESFRALALVHSIFIPIPPVDETIPTG